MLGDFLSPGALVALSGLFLAIALQARRIPGAILWAILFATRGHSDGGDPPSCQLY